MSTKKPLIEDVCTVAKWLGFMDGESTSSRIHFPGTDLAVWANMFENGDEYPDAVIVFAAFARAKARKDKGWNLGLESFPSPSNTDSPPSSWVNRTYARKEGNVGLSRWEKTMREPFDAVAEADVAIRVLAGLAEDEARKEAARIEQE